MPKFRKVTLLEEDLKRGELYVDILGFVYLYLGKTPEGNFHFFKCCRLNLCEYFLFYNFIFIIVKGYSKIIHGTSLFLLSGIHSKYTPLCKSPLIL